MSPGRQCWPSISANRRRPRGDIHTLSSGEVSLPGCRWKGSGRVSEVRHVARHATQTTQAPSRAVVLDARNNSLNLIRLVLALLVLVAHSYPLAGAGDGSVVRGESLGGWAVFGFFAISGYLISASR